MTTEQDKALKDLVVSRTDTYVTFRREDVEPIIRLGLQSAERIKALEEALRATDRLLQEFVNLGLGAAELSRGPRGVVADRLIENQALLAQGGEG